MSRQLMSARIRRRDFSPLLFYGAAGSAIQSRNRWSRRRSRDHDRPRPDAQVLRKQQAAAAADVTDAEYLGRLEIAARDAGAKVLSTGDSCDDFASVAKAADGTLFAAYAAYYDGHDQIRVHWRLRNGRWSTRTNVPLVQAQADIWMPQIAVDAHDRLWVIWCEQTGQSAGQTGNWDLYARSLEHDTWGKLVRLPLIRSPDINPHVTVDEKRNIHVVWQAHPNNAGDIYYCKFDGTSWSQPLAVTSDAESDWFPRVAVDASGTAWIAFDSYRNGDYDVFLTSVRRRKGRPRDSDRDVVLLRSPCQRRLRPRRWRVDRLGTGRAELGQRRRILAPAEQPQPGQQLGQHPAREGRLLSRWKAPGRSRRSKIAGRSR